MGAGRFNGPELSDRPGGTVLVTIHRLTPPRFAATLMSREPGPASIVHAIGTPTSSVRLRPRAHSVIRLN